MLISASSVKDARIESPGPVLRSGRVFVGVLGGGVRCGRYRPELGRRKYIYSKFRRGHRADLRTLSDFPHVDVVIAGPPCQPWSRAGKQLGSDDEREGLAPTIKTVRYTLPRAVVVENVPGMGSKSNRHHLDRFKRQLRALGYRVTEFMLNAASFGVPQNRHRIFVVAVRGTDPPTYPILGRSQ